MPSNLDLLARVWDLQREVNQWDIESNTVYSAVYRLQAALLDLEHRLADQINGRPRIQ